ncbi:unnamed protein product [Cuscuta europaea]|uniref:Uncharacterized protein n=1 Tax=Cuscuta europaea TaxID=41803 RepID=A0A9P1E399_CUSEU|nr:unnamed protein product [Cuscuta europaea]
MKKKLELQIYGATSRPRRRKQKKSQDSKSTLFDAQTEDAFAAVFSSSAEAPSPLPLPSMEPRSHFLAVVAEDGGVMTVCDATIRWCCATRRYGEEMASEDGDAMVLDGKEPMQSCFGLIMWKVF